MFEPILAGIVVFVLFVFSVDVFTVPEGKPNGLPLPKWMFTKADRRTKDEEKLGESLKKVIAQAIKDSNKEEKGKS